jgi:6-pyruvoyltetrahydropterin/6-carboxytetrahydropterin synthase
MSTDTHRVMISRRYDFEAAHFLPNVPKGHKCLNMHGHSYVVEVEITGPVQLNGNEAGMVCDFDPIDRCWRLLWNKIDHTCLNESWTPNPTVEICAKLVHDHFAANLNAPFDSIRVVYREGPRSVCVYPVGPVPYRAAR